MIYIKYTIKEIKDRIQNTLTGGYFYADNARINYGDNGWYVKFWDGKKMNTNIIDETTATILIGGSLID